MNGVIFWKKKWLSSSYWDDSKGNGNLYYHIPYTIKAGGNFSNGQVTAIVQRLFKKNPEFEHCVIEISHPVAPWNAEYWFTAIINTDDAGFFKKYGHVNKVGL